jgi:hypothetical protein
VAFLAPRHFFDQIFASADLIALREYRDGHYQSKTGKRLVESHEEQSYYRVRDTNVDHSSEP